MMSIKDILDDIKILIKEFLWRCQFKKVYGRCNTCDGKTECSYYYCPCSWNEHTCLKRKFTFKFLNK